MKLEDYSKYYIQGTDHYLIPKDEFVELFNEMTNWKEESKQLKDNWDELKKYIQNEYKRLHAILMTPSEYEMMTLLKVFDKMQEIEQGSDSNENN